ELSMEARIIWQWVSADEYHSAWWGDADVLPNGNRLGTFGTLDHSGSTSIGARLVEVSSEGDIVWEMRYPKDGDIAHGVYRMERIDFAPIVEINETYWIKSGEEAIINWEAFYNYRNKYEESGSYSILLDGTEIEANSINFERYWQPTKKALNLGILDNGNYNLTLVVEDEISHQNTQFVNLTVSKYPPDVNKTEGFPLISVFLPIAIMTVLSIKKRFFRRKRKRNFIS
ncbi:MAG: hypothetical protein KGD64_14320, partial [Candidatus Heimdallarchaeota archaeon]|nr:hypothetical protein [Candidatus Heimdallarchaeota archaeon]